MQYTENQLVNEKSRHEEWLGQQEGVTGIGIGLDQGGQPCIKIFTSGMSHATTQVITSRLRGLPIDFEETGEFRADDVAVT